MKMCLLRPYYGVVVQGDMHGQLGIVDYSSAVFPDLSLVYAATIAKESREVTMDVIDANVEKISPEECLDRMKEHYDMVVMKVAAATIKLDIAFAKTLKEKRPDTKVVITGFTAKILKEYIENDITAIDEIVEEPLENYIFQLVHGTSEKVELNKFPTIDYSVFPYQKYLDYDNQQQLTLMTSRGCMVNCSYCPYASYLHPAIEFRDNVKVLEDIKSIVKLGINNIQFRDQFFTADIEKVRDLCQRIIDSKLEITWTCETRIESLDTTIIELMKRAGLKKICFGVESGEKEILTRYKRPPYNIDRIKKIVEYAKKSQIETCAFYIVGFPDETWETIEKTYRLALALNSDFASFSIYSPIVLMKEMKKVNLDIFKMFTNEINAQVAKNFTGQQIEDIVNMLNFLYATNVKSLKDSFQYHYFSQKSRLRQLMELKDKYKMSRREEM